MKPQMRFPIQGRAVNGKRKMDLADSLSAAAKSIYHFQLRLPETSHRLVQNLQDHATICFRCRRRSHWIRDCPLISTNHKFLKIYCCCVHGFCKIRTSKNIGRNYGRSYYACPIKRGKKCKEFVKWCDHPVDESELRPPRYKYPMCSCGAGVCRKVKETSGPNEGRYFFACPIGQDRGSCNFRLWEDTLLAIPNISPLKPVNQNTDWSPQEAEIVRDTYWSPREAEIVTDTDWSPQKAEIVTGASDNTDLSTPVNNNVDHQDTDTMISVSWESLEENARSIFHPLTPASSTTHLSADPNHTNVNCVEREEHIQHYEDQKVRLANIRDVYVKAKAEFEASQQPPQSLQDQEAYRLKVMLLKVEDQIASWEVEIKEMKTRIGEIKARMMEAEENAKKLPMEGESSK